MFRNIVYVVLLLNLYKNLSPISFLLVSGIGVYASMCNNSTGDVLKVPVHILISSMFMLSSLFFIYLGKLCYIVDICSPSLI